MLVRSVQQVIGSEYDVDWGNGTSRRMLVRQDARGFTLTETYVRAGTSSRIRYDNHVEACYCVAGSGTVATASGLFTISPGTMYAPDPHEEHVLSSAEGMRLLCVFTPALLGTEQHCLSNDRASSY